MLGKSASQGDFSLDINSADEPSHMFAVRARRCSTAKTNSGPIFHNKGCYRSNFSQMKTAAVLQSSVAYVKLRPKKSKNYAEGAARGKKTFFGGNGIEVD